MKNNPVGWFEIYVQDLGRAKTFYESVFQLKLEKLNTPELEIWAFPMDMERWGAGAPAERWSRWTVFPQAVTASWSTSVAKTVPSRPPVRRNQADEYSAKKCR